MTPSRCDRRDFLRRSLATGGLLSLGGTTIPGFLADTARAARLRSNPAEGRRRLVVIQLLGGNDGLNTVVPHTHDLYKQARKALRIESNRALTITPEIGLHPDLKGLADLLENHRLAIVQGVGYPNPDRSHFRSMEIWETARRDAHPDALERGWLGRAIESRRDLSEPSDPPGLQIGRATRSLALKSSRVEVPAVTDLAQYRLRLSGDEATRAKARAALEAIARGSTPADIPNPPANPLLGFARRASISALGSSRRLEEVGPAPDSLSGSRFGLARRLGEIARVIRAGFSTPIFYTTLDGFDTHANQFQIHANLLRELADSVAAFHAALSESGHQDETVILIFSEFGRRVAENASLGTDHGAAAPVFVIGPVAQSGLIGDHPRLDDLDDGDLKHHTDFRRIYAALLEHWLKIPAQPVLGDFIPLNLFAV